MHSGTLTVFRAIILQNLRRRKFRALLSASGITFGVTILVAILLTNTAVTRTFSNSMAVLAARADLQVYADWAGLDPSVIELVRRDPDVETVAPILEITANLPHVHEGLLLVGIDFRQDPRVRKYGSFAGRVRVPDLFTLSEDKYALIVTDLFLKNHSLKINDSVQITTPQGLKPFNIRGVIETEGNISAMGGNWAIMELNSLRNSFERSERPSRLDVFLRSGADTEVVRARLSQTLGPVVQVEPPWMRSRAIEKMIEGIQQTLSMLGFVALLVGFFLIYNTASVSVIERHRELGILRACGASRKQVLSIFLLEGFFYGLIGAVVGTLLGIGAAQASLAFVSKSISSAYFIFLKVDQLQITPTIILIGMLSGVTASVAGAFYPALSASRLSPLDAIQRRKYRKDIGYNLRFGLIASLVLLALAALALLLHFTFGTKNIGYVITLILILALALSSPLAVALVATLLSKVFRRRFGIEGRLAVENTLRNPTRTGFTAAALIIGLAVVINTSGAITSLRDSINSWVTRIFSGDIIIAAHNPFTAGSVSAPLSEALIQDLLNLEGIAGASAIRYAKVTYGDYLISLLAVDGSLPGSDSGSGNTPKVYVSKNFALLFNIKPGAHLTLRTNAGQTEFVVTDLIEDYNYNWPKGTIIVTRELYKTYWSDSLVDQIILYLNPGTDLNAVRQDISSRYGAQYNLTVFSNREFRNNFMQVIDQQFSLTYAQLIITIVVMLFAVANTLLISVHGRRGEIGILRAIGASKRQNQKTVLLEAIVLGIAGVVYGTILGLLITYIFLKISLPEQTGWTASYVFPATGVILSLVAAFIIVAIGSIVPMREISRFPITKLIRNEP